MDEILDALRKFDKQRGWDLYETAKIMDPRAGVLIPYKDYAIQLYLIGLTGEVGEIANEVKKGFREEFGEARIDRIKEEIVDCFFFLLKLALTLEVDIKTEFFKKLRKNERRFPVKGGEKKQ